MGGFEGQAHRQTGDISKKKKKKTDVNMTCKC